METDAYLAAAAQLMGLDIAPEWQDSVVEFFRSAAVVAAVLEKVPLDDAELELAAVFRLPDDG
jgi:hypothetical protein